MDLRIAEKALQRMIQDAEEAYPDECCGFFYGHEETERQVQEAIPVKNSKKGDKRRRFEIAAQDYMQAERYAVENKLQLLGVYHSHPDHPARPSGHDLRQAVPCFSYIILSVQHGKTADITSWRLSDEAVFQEEIIHQTV